MNIEIINLSDLVIDEGIQTREAIDKAAVAEFADRMKAGDKFPPITVFFVAGQYILADGRHRRDATQSLGATTIDCDVREGTREDALLFSLRANTAHGIRRTHKDKRRAVTLALGAWSDWSDRKIAEACGVSDPFVGGIRSELLTISSPDEAPRVGRDGKKRKTKRKPRVSATTDATTNTDGAVSYTDSQPPSTRASPTTAKPNKPVEPVAAMKRLWKATGKTDRETFLRWAETMDSDLPKGDSAELHFLIKKMNRLMRINPAFQNDVRLNLNITP